MLTADMCPINSEELKEMQQIPFGECCMRLNLAEDILLTWLNSTVIQARRIGVPSKEYFDI